MLIMQHPSTNLLASSPHILRNVHASPPIATRLDLPSRHVDADNLEDTYVQFILHCNPGVPIESDTTVLREAFRTPPKSGGKSFSTWALFELITQFQSKEIKTWGELALKLGVEPPDQDKGQSSQKIQQYAVRLKRWMHSMHVDAFFEYLLDNPHPYWIDVPTDLNPVCEDGRDGVAAEDDMALRSLLPHIRPRRGRKRPDDENSSRSPNQRFKMEQESTHANSSGQDLEQLDMWSAQANARNNNYLFAQDPFGRVNMNIGHSGSWTGQDFAQTPVTAHPYTAVTPANANPFWADQTASEAKSGLTPTRPKTSRRHGAKVVSSAWRSGGPGGSGKTRGRPPINRRASSASTGQGQGQGQNEGTSVASPFNTFSAGPSNSPPSTFKQHSHQHPSPHMLDASITHPLMSMAANVPSSTMLSPAQHGVESQQQQQQQHDYNISLQGETQIHNPRVNRNRLSLQVPARVGAEVRLATPHAQPTPVVMVNGAVTSTANPTPILSHHHPDIETALGGSSEVQFIDPFGPSVAATVATHSMYNLQYQQSHHPESSHVQHHLAQSSQNTTSIYSTTTNMAQQATQQGYQHHRQHFQTPPQTLYQQKQPTPGSVSVAGSAASRLSTVAPSTATTTGFAKRRLPPTAVAVQTASVHFPDAADRTNMDALESLFTYELLSAAWTDAQGIPIAACGIDEATAVAHEMVENVRRQANGAQGFLMNLSALAGMTWLRTAPAPGAQRQLQVRRIGEIVEEGREKSVYDIHWDLQLGDVRSGFGLREAIAKDEWVRGGWNKRRGSSIGTQQQVHHRHSDAGLEHAGRHGPGGGVGNDNNEINAMLSHETLHNEDVTEEGEHNGSVENSSSDAEVWRRRYHGLLKVMQDQHEEMTDFRKAMVDLMRRNAGDAME
ncbi:ARS binding protein 2-domain-containing protein [Coniella lustricola]|uniref:ARS binding protein 2-domain-containing protein n=1 Tax=Coniella lustricola TaxID=2025994 RepID=A0A2T2ZUD6_9PEZI|nr:ARS binding protein 2-domain-containing protein [Coniella lustricola]